MTVAGVDAADTSKISKTKAYTMIAEELQKASSIGADSEAKVTNNNDGTFDIKQGTVTYKDKLTFNLHVGADADMTNKINVDVNSMSAASLGVKGLNVNDDTGVAATYAIDAIADAVSKVSEQRSALGAIQNRLEHTIANVDNVVENSTAAESRIRDTDMADEMVNFSKNNILAQAGQAMLAQANQATQGVLSILG
jgi:flagellin-like hook-associated protein FlgL